MGERQVVGERRRRRALELVWEPSVHEGVVGSMHAWVGVGVEAETQVEVEVETAAVNDLQKF